MAAVCFYFQVHQPYRLRHYTFFDIGADAFYEDENANCDILLKVARKCYLPMNTLLLSLIRRHEGRFKVSFSLSGTALDQFVAYAPELIQSYRELVATGCVELLSETYNHSLAFLYSPEEFREQVRLHDDRIEELFGVRPTVFRNTELIYNNALARTVEDMGYAAILAEGADHVLGWRSPNYVYRPTGCGKLKLLLKNYRLSDDIAFRFSDRNWPEFPLTAEKFAHWAGTAALSGDLINLFMDYETFGEHQWEASGIFQFMEALPDRLLRLPGFRFVTPSEAAATHEPVAELDVHNFMSWADAERDLTAWLGNDMQHDAIETVYRMEERVKARRDDGLLRTWRRLQTSDHFYYMCTKWFADGDVHSYFNPYGSPYDAYINYMNVMADFALRLDGSPGLGHSAEMPPRTDTHRPAGHLD
ncbi:glycoside hydrolase family 57 protein [uncultured Desulfovibrio sp.]|uniref:glycoside hydrolase family 57 protein n=1 Tax=uncultured Desulfovibrio sp. TaxID=167968 RepID=UPI002613D313|nr:glycoside hydrolase family 57 protein [uncultured Desulfovibrio sp.]